jgi:SAM-dependent methyltransferase
MLRIESHPYKKKIMANKFFKAVKSLKRKIKSITQIRLERRHSMVGYPKLWKLKRDFQIQFLLQTGLQPYHQFLEIGFGTLRGGIPIIQYLNEGHYTGTEIRMQVLKEAKKELHEAELLHKKPELIIEPDIKNIKFTKKFNYIWAFSVLTHMENDILNDCFSFVYNNLSEHGVFYANVSTACKPQGEWHGFPVMHHSLNFYKEYCLKAGLVCASIGTLKELGHLTSFPLQDNQVMLKIWKA